MMSVVDEVSCLMKEGNNERAKAILKENPELYELDELSLFQFLHYCAVYGNVNMVHYLLDNGCHIDISDRLGRTPLMFAVQAGQTKVAEVLLSAGADFDELSALHFAVYYEDFRIVELLLKSRAAVTLLDIQGRTPLFYLYYRNPKHSDETLKILKLFLDYRTFHVLRWSRCAIFQIANILMRGNHEAVRLVLQSYPNFMDEEKRSKKTMLHHLARNKNPRVIEELRLHIDKLNVNAVDKKGHNPLYWALKAGNINMVRYLLEKGATVTKVKSNLKAGRLIKLLEHNEVPQFIPNRDNRRKVKIFDVMAAKTNKENNSKKIKIIIAHLAMLKQLAKTDNQKCLVEGQVFAFIKKVF